MKTAVKIAVGTFVVIALVLAWGVYDAVSRDFIACRFDDLVALGL